MKLHMCLLLFMVLMVGQFADASVMTFLNPFNWLTQSSAATPTIPTLNVTTEAQPMVFVTTADEPSIDYESTPQASELNMDFETTTQTAELHMDFETTTTEKPLISIETTQTPPIPTTVNAMYEEIDNNQTTTDRVITTTQRITEEKLPASSEVSDENDDLEDDLLTDESASDGSKPWMHRQELPLQPIPLQVMPYDFLRIPPNQAPPVYHPPLPENYYGIGMPSSSMNPMVAMRRVGLIAPVADTRDKTTNVPTVEPTTLPAELENDITETEPTSFTTTFEPLFVETTTSNIGAQEAEHSGSSNLTEQVTTTTERIYEESLTTTAEKSLNNATTASSIDITTPSLTPVYNPEKHLTTTTTVSPLYVKPQFLYNADFAAELNRLYFSNPSVFDGRSF